MPEDAFVQYSADNVDHNTCNIDGKGTFHGMGISMATHKNDITLILILRQKLLYSPNWYSNHCWSFSHHIHCHQIKQQIFMADTLFFHQHNRPSWSGFTQTHTKGKYPSKT